jgi:hypothetical protein
MAKIVSSNSEKFKIKRKETHIKAGNSKPSSAKRLENDMKRSVA